MATPHVPGKPRIGTFVDYYNPRLMQRIGFTEGYGKRAEGPYAALVMNNLGHGLVLMVFLPGVTPIEFADVPHREKAVAFTSSDGTNIPNAGSNINAYWDWQTQSAAARAAKELKEHEAAVEVAQKAAAEALVATPEIMT